MDAISEAQPDEVYNLASQSYVPISWTQPALTAEYTAIGVSRLLESIRRCKPDTRFYQASSSEAFGQPDESPQTERTAFRPRNPYGIAKAYAHWMTVNISATIQSLHLLRYQLYPRISPTRHRVCFSENYEQRCHDQTWPC